MFVSSCRSPRRLLMSVVFALLTAASLMSCGGKTTPIAGRTTASPSADASSSEVRLGCGTFCQNAGGYGAAPSAVPEIPAVTIVSTGSIISGADGYIPITVRCDLPVQCSGALSLDLAPFGVTLTLPTIVGRSDLLVDGGTTRTLGVLLPPEALAYVRSHGPTTTWVTADTRPVRPCAQIPQLAAKCADIAQTNGFGDGIERVSGRELTLAAPG
jgi:hypothetical protein